MDMGDLGVTLALAFGTHAVELASLFNAPLAYSISSFMHSIPRYRNRLVYAT
jgi:hypothetical protein